MAIPTYTIDSIDKFGNINITISAGSSYKDYYFEVYIRYDEPSSTEVFLETGPIQYRESTIKLPFTRDQLAHGGQFAINVGMYETADGAESYLGKKNFSTALLEYYNESTLFEDEFYVSLTSSNPSIKITNSVPTRAGYAFQEAWEVQSGSTSYSGYSFDSGSPGSWPGGYYKLKAMWEEIPSYKINFTFTTNGGKWADGTTASKTITYRNYDNDQVAIKMLAAPTTPPTGKIFYYWQVSAGPDRIGDQYSENASGIWTGSLTGKSYTLKATWTTPGSDGVVYVNEEACILYVYVDNSWKQCEPWIYSDGKWNLCIE